MYGSSSLRVLSIPNAIEIVGRFCTEFILYQVLTRVFPYLFFLSSLFNSSIKTVMGYKVFFGSTVDDSAIYLNICKFCFILQILSHEVIFAQRGNCLTVLVELLVHTWLFCSVSSWPAGVVLFYGVAGTRDLTFVDLVHRLVDVAPTSPFTTAVSVTLLLNVWKWVGLAKLDALVLGIKQDCFQTHGFSFESTVCYVVIGWSVFHHVINRRLRLV